MFDQHTPTDALLIPASRLRAICRQLGRAVARRPVIPALETVLIKARGTGTTFHATDLDLEVNVTAEDITTSAPFCACVPFRVLSRLAASTTGILRVTHQQPEPRGGQRARLTFATDDGVTATINLLCPHEDFPVSYIPPGWPTMTLAPSALHRLLSLTLPCISTEETRYYLNGVFLTRKPDCTTLRAVATDGHRLAVIDDATEAPERLAVILPTAAVKAILHLTNRCANDNVTVQIAADRICVVSGAIRMHCRLIDANFPDCTRALRAHPMQHSVTWSAGALQSLLPLAIERNAVVQLADGRASLCCELGEVSVPVPMVAAPDAEPGQVYGFNLHYLLSQARMTPTFQMALACPVDPARVTGEDPDALWLIMPMRK